MTVEFLFALLWIGIAIVLGIVEVETAQFVSIWGAIGAIVTAFPAYLGVNFEVQLLVFAITTVLLLILTRPFVSKIAKPKVVHTNAKMVIGCVGIVTEQIDNESDLGRATVNGISWTARAEKDDVLITPSTKVEVLAIEGVKLIVRPKI